jgi:hypothetical protein
MGTTSANTSEKSPQGKAKQFIQRKLYYDQRMITKNI